MDVVLVSKNIIKIKGKNSSLIVGISSAGGEGVKTKIPADAVVLLKRDEVFDVSKVESQRLVVRGPGEYEISGIKISASAVNNELIYDMQVDNLNVLVATMEAAKRAKEKLKEEKVIILYANSEADSSVITALEPRVAMFYGENAGEVIKALGKEVKPVSKYSITSEKLPAEMETVHLDS